MIVKSCPACRSRDITLDTGGQTGKWRCKRCGYIGPLVVEEDMGDPKDRTHPRNEGEKS